MMTPLHGKSRLEIVDDSELMNADKLGASTQGDFLKKENDPALKETGWEEQVNPIK